MKKPFRNYQEDLIQDLKSPGEAAAYLNAALEAGDRQAFLLALRNVLDANGGMSKIARQTKINRVSLYKMLSENGNPEFGNILRLLRATGVRFAIHPESEGKSQNKAA